MRYLKTKLLTPASTKRLFLIGIGSFCAATITIIIFGDAGVITERGSGTGMCVTVLDRGDYNWLGYIYGAVFFLCFLSGLGWVLTKNHKKNSVILKNSKEIFCILALLVSWALIFACAFSVSRMAVEHADVRFEMIFLIVGTFISLFFSMALIPTNTIYNKVLSLAWGLFFGIIISFMAIQFFLQNLSWGMCS